MTLTPQNVTPEAVMALKSGQRGSSSTLTSSSKQLAIPRIPKYDRASTPSRMRNTDCMVLSGKAVLADDILPAGITMTNPEQRPSSRYMLDIASITAAAEASLMEFSSSGRADNVRTPPLATKQRPPSSGGHSSSVKVGEYSPRVLRDMGLPIPPSKRDRGPPTKQASVTSRGTASESSGGSVSGGNGSSVAADKLRAHHHDPRLTSRIPRSSRAS